MSETRIRPPIQDVEKLTRKEIRTAASLISEREVRHLVRNYYQAQDNRKRTNSQMRALETHEGIPAEESALLQFFTRQHEVGEDMLKKAMDDYTLAHPIGSWIREVFGIGPITAAGLLAHIDISKCPTVGHIWSFAGYNPNMKWEKGQVRPFNQDLKVICFHIGQAFMKFSANEKCVYGKLYLERKAYEVARNESGGNKHLADEALTNKRYGTTTDAFMYVCQGKLPPAQIDARARRWAVKIFLSHLHQYWYQVHFGVPAPAPFAIAILGHAHMIHPPVHA